MIVVLVHYDKYVYRYICGNGAEAEMLRDAFIPMGARVEVLRGVA